MKVPFYEYIENQKKQKFSGTLKFSFECGSLVGISRSNTDGGHLIPVVDTDPLEFFNDVKSRFLNGNYILFFDGGKITKYGFCETYKGESLRALLGGLNADL